MGRRCTERGGSNVTRLLYYSTTIATIATITTITTILDVSGNRVNGSAYAKWGVGCFFVHLCSRRLGLDAHFLPGGLDPFGLSLAQH